MRGGARELKKDLTWLLSMRRESGSAIHQEYEKIDVEMER